MSRTCFWWPFRQQMRHDAHDDVLLLRLALCNQEGGCHKSSIREAAFAGCIVQGAVLVQEPEEQCRRYAFVAIQENAWFFTTKYSRLAAFASTPG